MLTAPEISQAVLVSQLRHGFGVSAVEVAFLPLGADMRSAVYRVSTVSHGTLLLKLRAGTFEEWVLSVPAWLVHEAGMAHLMAPLARPDGSLWLNAEGYAWMLYPFVDGADGFQRALSEPQWRSLGETVRGLHDVRLPESLWDRLPQETYVSTFRDQAARIMDQPPGALQAIVHQHEAVLRRLHARASQLGNHFRHAPPPVVTCHADLHAGNVLLAGADTLWLTDWDTLVRAPRERDLMFIGAGVGGVWQPSECGLFYQGYGNDVTPDAALISYYRCERILVDLVEIAEMVTAPDIGTADRDAASAMLSDQFLPGNVVDIALASLP